MHIQQLQLLIDMNKHSRCLLANKECITSCHSQQMGWPVQWINNDSCPNSSTACNKQLLGETPAHLVWLHNVKTGAYLKMLFKHGWSVFSRTGMPLKTTQWLTDLIGFGSRQGFDVERERERETLWPKCLCWFFQRTQRGCNYAQSAGIFHDIGWAETRRPQLQIQIKQSRW